MPSRKKPFSHKQKKAELQLKRAQKRGDAEKPPPQAKRHDAQRSRGRGSGGPLQTVADASRRLESSFVKFSPAFLEEAKQKASTIVVDRPIPLNLLLYPAAADVECASSELTVMKRPKWKYEMSKKEVESNEAGLFKKWLEESDTSIQRWAQIQNGDNTASVSSPDSHNQNEPEGSEKDFHDQMPIVPPLFERNLEVWRQLWRVTEICQILLILLDSRCPPLHYPSSLQRYLATLRPARKIIFVLTKCDIPGPDRAAQWKNHLQKSYPSARIVYVESYATRSAGEGQGKRKVYEPYMPSALKDDIVEALRTAHAEMCLPPPPVAADPEKAKTWKPRVNPKIDWDAVRNARLEDVTTKAPERKTLDQLSESGDAEDEIVDNFVSIGLIGQPNVGKSSLLNALFGEHKVKASKTPGKTKHFQTLFWTPQVRLVDCPGLVFPSYAQLELQVLAGILPIAQLPAIPSSIHYALQRLPLEKILELKHPAKNDAAVENKRTWRHGMKRPDLSQLEARWTTMDVLTAYAEKRGWITAKAGRPDVNRAGNAILRALAEGRIKWGFYPPDFDISEFPEHYGGCGIWIQNKGNDVLVASDDEESEPDSNGEESLDESTVYEEEPGSEEAASSEDDVNFAQKRKMNQVGGMFGALSIDEDDDDESLNE